MTIPALPIPKWALAHQPQVLAGFAMLVDMLAIVAAAIEGSRGAPVWPVLLAVGAAVDALTIATSQVPACDHWRGWWIAFGAAFTLGGAVAWGILTALAGHVGLTLAIGCALVASGGLDFARITAARSARDDA